MGIFNYIRKVKKIQKNIGSIAVFTPSEMVFGMVNLLQAKQKLTAQEYFYISVIYEAYRMIKEEVCLDYFGYLGLCSDIVANFDLVAPYYKFCGSNQLQIASFIDAAKMGYRNKAKMLLEEKKLFTEEWSELHDEFMEKFYR